MSIPSRRWLSLVAVLLLVVVILWVDQFRVNKVVKEQSAENVPQERPSPQITPETYSQSGGVTTVSPTQLTIGYSADSESNGKKTSVYAYKTYFISDATPVVRLTHTGNEYKELPSKISSIRAGMLVVVYVAQLSNEGPPVQAQKIEIIEQ